MQGVGFRSTRLTSGPLGTLLGVGLMIIAQKPWEMVKTEVDGYRQRYLAINGMAMPNDVPPR